MIALEDVSVGAGDFRLDGVSLSVPAGAYGVLMGPTGSGKTTLLKALCGLHPLRSGTIRLADADVSSAPPNARGVGYVPQDAQVFPRMTVRDNLAFPLLMRRRTKRQIETAVERLAQRLGVASLLRRRGAELSGGEAQRVALGRALAAEPVALLLDEPLTALDDAARSGVVALLKEVQAEMRVTTLHVTHNRQEAEHLADLLLEIEGGRVVEVPGAPTT